MKHLFAVHSNATFRCSVAVASELSLEAADCLFLEYRGFSIPDLSDCAGEGDGGLLTLSNARSLRSVFRRRRNLRSLDNQITKLAKGARFHCYLPHSYYDGLDLLVTHPLCEAFSYIEEGLTSYYFPDEIDRAYPPWIFTNRCRLARYLLLGGRARPAVGFYRKDYESAYGFTDSSFPDWPRRRTLGLKNLFPQLEVNPLSRKPVLVFDALVELQRTTAASFLSALERFLDYLVQHGIDELRYKFHSGQRTASSRMAVQNLFADHESHIKFEELGSDVSLEDLFATEDCIVYGFNSAAILYAALAGRRVFSLNRFLKDADSDYAKTTQVLPKIYHEKVPTL